MALNLRTNSASLTLFIICASLIQSSVALTSSPDTQLVDAAREGNLADVKDALAAGAQVNTQAGPTALLEVGSQGSRDQAIDVITELLNHGADINAEGPDGSTAFQKALNGLYYADVVPLFLAHHPDLKITDAQGNGVLSLCIQRENLKLVPQLMDAGAPVDTANLDGVTPLMWVAKGNQYRSYRINEYTDLAKYLISKGADPTRSDKAGKTPASYALENNNYDLLLLLDQSKQYAEKYDEVKKADQTHRLGSLVVQHMLSKIKVINGPPPENIDTIGLITALLQAGADSNAMYPPENITIFGLALGGSRNHMFEPLDPQLIGLLLNHGADPNKPYASGNIPLVAAARDKAIFELLLSKGADPTVEITEQTTSVESPGPAQPPQMVQKQTKTHLVNILAEQGLSDSLGVLIGRKANLEQADSNGLTPLLNSISHGNSTAAQTLIDGGANIKATTSSGQTAADLAATALDISLLRKIDSAGKYASLLKEYNPPPDVPVIGDWYLGKYLALKLLPDGGGFMTLRGPDHALAWKAVENNYEVDTLVAMSPQAPSALFPMKFGLTYDPEKKRLSLQQGVGAGQSMTLIRKDDPNPPNPMAQMQPPTPEPSDTKEKIHIAIANAEASPNAGLTLIQPDLTEFPPEAYDITALSFLQIAGTQIQILPNELGQFRLLTRAYIHDNKISEIQDGFFNLTNLEELQLNSNRLTSISPKVTNLKKLTSLLLYDNRISSLPEGWEQMESLKSFAVGGNRLTQLPVSLAKAPQLNWISASDNLLVDLPAEWAGMGLNGLDIGKNHFTKVPPVILQIQGLTYINLEHNEITEIPLGLASMATLERLNMSYNHLTAIPDLRNTKISDLDLSGNDITSFPPSKDFFPPTLRELHLRGNKISDVPDWIYEMNLRFVDLGGNALPDDKVRAINDRLRQAEDAKRTHH